MTERHIEDAELHALVDGELDPARQAEVEAWLSDHPDAAQRVARYRAQNAGMHALFDDVLNEDLPDNIAGALSGRPAWRNQALALAAGIALLVAGAAAGWLARDAYAPDDGAAQVAAVEPPIDTQELMVRAAMAHTVNADEDLQVRDTAPDAMGDYLSTRMGVKVRVPRLESFGYRLTGARILPDTGGPAAQFVYTGPDGKMVTLYVRSEKARGVDITYALADDLSMFYWNDSQRSYALVADAEDKPAREALLTAARAVHGQIAE